MADQIPFGRVENILTKLASIAFQEIGSMYGVPKEMTKLSGRLGAIKDVLLDAEEKQQQNKRVKDWVRRLKDVVYDADDLLDAYETHYRQRGGVARQVRLCFTSENLFVFRFKMSRRLEGINGSLDDIVKDIPLIKLIPRDTSHTRAENGWRDTHSFVLKSEIVGREENKEEIIGKLLSSDGDENPSVVAIVGIGGLGKTTLAQLVYNDDEKVGKHFDTKMWVCVCNGFELTAVVKNIVRATTNKDTNNLELDQLQNLLHRSLDGKRYLLVLDDVSNEDPEKWDQLRILLATGAGAHGSKILVTTRKARVASVMRIDSPYNLEPLGEESSWDLFRSLAFRREEKARPDLVTIGKEIVKSCNGVPQVIRHVAHMLHSKTEESQWMYVKNSTNFLSMDA